MDVGRRRRGDGASGREQADCDAPPAVPRQRTLVVGHGDLAWRLTPMVADHVPSAVGVYVRSFQESFLTSFGQGFLRRFLVAFTRDVHAYGLVAVAGEGQDDVLGFVVGSEDLARHYRAFVLRNVPFLVFTVVSFSITQPSAIGELAHRLWHGVTLLREATSAIALQAEGLDQIPRASLMSVAVDPEVRRRGVASSLVQAFTAEMASRGVSRVKLGVRESNVGARRVYEHLGWRPVLSRLTPEGERGWLYIWEQPN